MIRHTLVEGWLLLRQRWLVSTTLAVTLAVPVCLAGLTLSLSRWLGPLVSSTQQTQVVAVLLHPQMDQEERRIWLAEQSDKHPQRSLEEVPAEQLVQRLVHWFPYLEDLFEDETAVNLPPLVEVTVADGDSLDDLRSEPAVLAVGPHSSLHQILRRAARRLGLLLATLSVILVAAAVLLASIWVHLELYRHASEITIMRLIGATEMAVRGPFLLAVAAPGLLAALLSLVGTRLLAGFATRLVANLGLPPLTLPTGVLILQACLAFALPVVAAALTLARHARSEFEE